MRTFAIFLALTLTLALGTAPSEALDPSASAGELLADFVEDYASDRTLGDDELVFGIEVRDADWWTVEISALDETVEEDRVHLRKGRPPVPTFFYTVDTETLRRVHSGRLAALTAMGKAKSSDETRMDLEVMEGFVPDGSFVATVLPLSFHFWTRGLPERIPFGDRAESTFTHGTNLGVFYYQPGFRSAWFRIEKGDHVNEDPSDQVNPFPSLFIVTAGRVQARIGGEDTFVDGGQAVLIPADVAHEFWNEDEAAGEGILLMFGDGA